MTHNDTGMGATEAGPALSLIVCTIGRRGALERLLLSLTVQRFRDFEVIVVDQNEPGVLDDMIKAFGARLDIVHVASAPGLSAARNLGLALARGRVIAFPDDDCWYQPTTLDDVVDRMQREPSVAIVTGKTVDRAGKDSVSLFLTAPARVTRANYLACGNSNSLFFRRDVFRRIGNFDVRLGVGACSGFHSGEEADIVLRALDAGLVASYRPDLRVHHDQVDGTITEAQMRRATGYGRGFGALMRKHRFGFGKVLYRIGRPAIGALLYLMLGRAMLARYKWAWSRAIAQGYRDWARAGSPPSAPEAPSAPVLSAGSRKGGDSLLSPSFPAGAEMSEAIATQQRMRPIP